MADQSLSSESTASGVSEAEEDVVLMEVQDGVAVITLNRPERLNALDVAMQRMLPARLQEAAGRDDVRAIVLTGAGRGFCAGADLEVLSGLGDGEQFTMPERELLTARTIPKPVICAINGPSAGIGLVFALACDIRFATPEAKFGTGFARRGLVAEQGLAWLLTNLTGPSRALDLLFTSRIFDGTEAHQLGLVDQLHAADELLPAAIEYARGLAKGSSSVSMGVMKWQVQRAQAADFWTAFDDDVEITKQALTGRDFVTIGATIGKHDTPDYLPIPAGVLGDTPPVHLIPPVE